MADIKDKLVNKLYGLDSTKDTVDVKSPIHSILEQRIKQQQNPTPEATAPAVPLISIDGYVLPGDAMTLLMYTFATVLSKNKEVKKVLDSFKFQFVDINGSFVYPRPSKVKAKTKKISKNVKSK